MRRPLFIELESVDNYGMAETTIKIGDHILGYVGASRYVSTTESEAEEIVVDLFRSLLEGVPGLEPKSRFVADWMDDESSRT